jgi:transposase InsO family protein
MKEDCIWINEFETYEQVLLSIDQWINFYYNQYIHSAIEHMSPNEFSQKYYTLKAA